MLVGKGRIEGYKEEIIIYLPYEIVSDSLFPFFWERDVYLLCSPPLNIIVSKETLGEGGERNPPKLKGKVEFKISDGRIVEGRIIFPVKNGNVYCVEVMIKINAKVGVLLLVNRHLPLNEWRDMFEKYYFEPDPVISLSNFQSYEGYYEGWDFWVDKIMAKKPKKVLEIGAAKCYIVEKLRQKGVFSVGCDISLFALSSKPNKETNAVLASVTHLPFKDGFFDVVFSLEVFEHIPRKYMKQAVAEAKRVGKYQIHGISGISYPDDQDITHVNLLSPIEWRKLFGENAEIVSEEWGQW